MSTEFAQILMLFVILGVAWLMSRIGDTGSMEEREDVKQERETSAHSRPVVPDNPILRGYETSGHP